MGLQGLPGVTGYYRGLQMVNRGQQGATEHYGGLRGLQRIKWSFSGLQGLPEVTAYYGGVTDG